MTTRPEPYVEEGRNPAPPRGARRERWLRRLRAWVIRQRWKKEGRFAR